MAEARLIDRRTGEVLVQRLEIAADFWHRWLGWQFRRLPPPGYGLLLAPCSHIHTFWMRFAIDLVFLDRHGTVLAVRNDVPPWRVAFAPRGTWAVVEVPAAGSRGLVAGQSVMLETATRHRALRSLQPANPTTDLSEK